MNFRPASINRRRGCTIINRARFDEASGENARRRSELVACLVVGVCLMLAAALFLTR